MKDIGTIFGYESRRAVFLGRKEPASHWYIGNDNHVVWNGFLPDLIEDLREIFLCRRGYKDQAPTARKMACGLQNEISDRDYSNYKGGALFGSGEGVSSLKVIGGHVGVSLDERIYAQGPQSEGIYERLWNYDPSLGPDLIEVMEDYEIIEIPRNDPGQISVALSV